MVSVCTAKRLADEEMTDWFLFYFVETSDQLSNSAKFIQHEGVLEMPGDAPWTMEPDELKQFMWKFESLANDEVGPATNWGGHVEVEHEERKITLVEDVSGRLPSVSTDELKEIVASALERTHSYTFSWVEDTEMDELEAASVSSNGSDNADKQLQVEGFHAFRRRRF